MQPFTKRSPAGDERGFTLMEALIAVAVLSVGLLGIAGLQVSAIRQNSAAQERSVSTNWAAVRIDQLINAPYTHALLVDTNQDGTGQDANGDLTDDDAGNFGLDNTLDQNGNIVADHSETRGGCILFWNVAVNQPYVNTKTVNVIIRWKVRGNQKETTFRFIKSRV